MDHFIRGRLVEGGAVRHCSRDLGVDFATPEIRLNELVTPRSEPAPLLDVPLDEIIRFLASCGERMALDSNPYLQEAMERTLATNILPRRIVENLYRSAPYFLQEPVLRTMVESSFANPAALDGWVERQDVFGHQGAMRAFPPRMIHMLAGNAPTGCLASIIQGALVKAVNVFKMPSSDPFTCVAMLRTMAEVDPDHPVVKSMSAVYWRGGDKSIEPTLYRPQYFDRIVAWGGGDAINNVISYLGPGLQLVSFDPKNSISMIGPEGFESSEVIDQIAEAAAEDVSVFNQEACLASRFIFVEGERSGIETFCARLQERLGVDREAAS
ncbi:MAG: acyl-CoA reductase, partial [Chloroflexota bacterium]